MPNGRGNRPAHAGQGRGIASAPGLDKELILVHIETGEEMTVTQREWVQNGKQYRADGFFPLEDDEDEGGEGEED